MKLVTKFATVAVATALVAGPVALAAAPAQAAPAAKATGTTLVSFKKQYASLIKLIQPVAPTKFIGSKISFPVTGVKGTTVTHSGGITVGGVPATNPVIVVNAKKKTATVSFSINGTLTQLFYAEHFKNTAGGGKSASWQGDLHLTKDANIVGLLNQLLGNPGLTPGLGLGQIRTTYKIG